MNGLQQVLTLVRALPPPPLSHSLRRAPLQDQLLCFSHLQQVQKSLGGQRSWRAALGGVWTRETLLSLAPCVLSPTWPQAECQGTVALVSALLLTGFVTSDESLCPFKQANSSDFLP